MHILMPLPTADFDPTEAGVSYGVLTEAGHRFTFATPTGEPATPDPRMLTGEGLGVWRSLLSANAVGRAACNRLTAAAAFQKPISHDAMVAASFDALVLPGGHAPGMRSYLESGPLQRTVAAFFAAHKPVGAICHGVVVAARTVDPATGKSVLHGRKTTALTAWMELSAWALTAAWLGSYYRTYPQTVEGEVKSHLANPRDFLRGPWSSARDGPGALGPGFTVQDKNYLSARWPGDAHRFATQFSQMVGSV